MIKLNKLQKNHFYYFYESEGNGYRNYIGFVENIDDNGYKIFLVPDVIYYPITAYTINFNEINIKDKYKKWRVEKELSKEEYIEKLDRYYEIVEDRLSILNTEMDRLDNMYNKLQYGRI